MSTWRAKALALLAAAALSACGTGKAVKHDDAGDGPGRHSADGRGAPPVLKAEHAAFAVTPLWVKGPAASDDNQLTLTFFADEAKTAPQSVENVAIKTWMPDMGHPGPKKVTIARDPARANQFNVSKLNLVMPGLWEVTVTATVNGAEDHAVFVVNL